MNYVLGLGLNRDPPDLCLLSSWDYRRESPVPDPLTVSKYILSLKFLSLKECFFFFPSVVEVKMAVD
jgi:hypothetical protein